MKDKLRILILEDQVADAELMERKFRTEDVDFSTKCVKTKKDFELALSEFRPDLILSDYNLPGFDGLSALELAKQICPLVPFIFISGSIGEEKAVELLRRGATDYVLKDNLTRLMPVVTRALREAEEREALRKAEEDQKRYSRQFRSAQEMGHIGSWVWDVAANTVSWSDEMYRVYGLEPHEFNPTFEGFLERVHPDDRALVQGEIQKSLETKQPFEFEIKILQKNGQVRTIHSRGGVMLDDAGSVTHMYGFAQDITERKQAEEALLERARLAELQAEVGIISTQAGGPVEILKKCAEAIVNHLDAAFARIWTLNEEEMVLELQCSAGMYTHLDGPHGRVPVGKFKIGLIAEERMPHLTNDVQNDPRVGDPEWARREKMVAFAGYPLIVEGKLIGVLALFARHVLTDYALKALLVVADTIAVSIKRKREAADKDILQEQLIQSQKIEAIGQLAGGIAHDFNNLLTVIIGHTEFLLERVGDDAGLVSEIETIRKAADRAANLTHQLLAFSRRQILQPKVLDLAEGVAEMQKMLRRLIGENIELVTVSKEDLGPVKADQGQLEQVIMNLAVNARDAMPDGGKLIIETANAFFDKPQADGRYEVPPGRYVRLTVTDTGSGMSPEVQKRIFEPFFTTKEPGKGTGLGLATVFGIVKQSEGHITVGSTPGRGTSFNIYLPMAAEAVETAAGTEKLPFNAYRGTETILLVEDEESVRTFTQKALGKFGYTVLQAANGEEALAVAKKHIGPLSLIVTDLVLPKMNGLELAGRLKEIRPEARIIFMSGYTDETIVRKRILSADSSFLQKPFTSADLAKLVRKVLDKGQPEPLPNEKLIK